MGGGATRRSHAMSRQALPTPREWIGDAPFPWTPPYRLAHGDDALACCSLIGLRWAAGADGAAMLLLELSDAHGRITGWLGADDPAVEWLRAGIYVGVRGQVEGTAADRRLRVEVITPLRVPLDDLELFLPRTSHDLAALDHELNQRIESVQDPGLRTLLQRLLGATTEIGRGFRLAPAATRNHHAYLGGLLEHTLSVVRTCDVLAAHYGDAVDRDLLITGALVHDIGKVREIGAQVGFPYTDEGRLLGHIVLGLRMIADEALMVPQLDPRRRLLLEHLVASHQGRYEWQSPREPRIIEAFILHYVDDLDAKVNHAGGLIDSVQAGWTDYDRSLGRELLRHRPKPVTPPPEAAASSPPTGKRTARTKSKSKSRSKSKRGRAKKKAARRGKSAARGRATRAPELDERPRIFFDRDTIDLFAG
jgi:3'-5' exoribonuclease